MSNTVWAGAGIVIVAVIVSSVMSVQTPLVRKNHQDPPNLLWPLRCARAKGKVMSLSVPARRHRCRNLGAAMESFIHLRKGKTPRRLHADLEV